MISSTDTSQRKRKAPPAANWQGLLSTNELTVSYHTTRILQLRCRRSVWPLEGLQSEFNADIERRIGVV